MRVAIIPARGGSLRVLRKNVRDFHGRPMLSYPIRTARECGLFDLIIISTDDAEIAAVAFSEGAVVVPREADDGTTGTQEIAARVLDKLEITGGCACVIYATSPLLYPQDLLDGYAALQQQTRRNFVRSVGPDEQDAGCFYWGWTRSFRDRKPLDGDKTIDHMLPATRVCDINTPDDWVRAESLYTALRRANP